jgi:hypothetical protein
MGYDLRYYLQWRCGRKLSCPGAQILSIAHRTATPLYLTRIVASIIQIIGFLESLRLIEMTECGVRHSFEAAAVVDSEFG